ncbi:MULTISPECIES: hypothetical protein [unclassified Methylibium]|jgi:hypothetical protein|uniref:hypothetical protein n=1 Tax=unclassified Methylibium TaxID=2633235 RepID=UPI0006FE672C|nr:hypothetical protein [Methylibium sp. Root1272]KQW76296.1 hypothetical protein ASC67_01060 [Methylibium sp. Root1272]
MSRWKDELRVLAAAGLLASAVGAGAQEPVIYKCPGNLYTSALTPKEALAKGCKTLEGAPITVIQGPARRAPAATSSSESRPADSRVDPADQKARDTDKRRILETELRREEERLTALKQEYNNGQPERRGDEKNYQKYLDRVAEMKASIERSESDVAALRRELSKAAGGSGG